MKNVASATNKNYYIIILSNLMLFGTDDNIKTENVFDFILLLVVVKQYLTV